MNVGSACLGRRQGKVLPLRSVCVPVPTLTRAPVNVEVWSETLLSRKSFLLQFCPFREKTRRGMRTVLTRCYGWTGGGLGSLMS